MNATPDEQDFLELAQGVRKVRTLEGSKYYGLPVGAPITADVIAAKKAEGAAKGISSPKGGLSKGPKTSSSGGGGKIPTVKTAPAAGAGDSSGPQKPKAPLKLVHMKPTINGPKKFKVGESSYSAPEGSILITPVDSSGLVYVLAPDGFLHAFNEVDEVGIPTTLEKVFAAKFTKDFKGDDKYSIGEFDTDAEKSLKALPVDAVLEADGEPQFKKLANGDWEHVDIGAVLNEADVQPLYDSGELTLSETPEGKDDAGNTDFGLMTPAEFQKALLGFDTGKKLYLGTAVLTLRDSGKWHSSLSGTEIQISNSLRSSISEKAPATKDDVAAADAKSKGEEAPVAKETLQKKPAAKKPEVNPAAPVEKKNSPEVEKSSAKANASMKEFTDGLHEKSGTDPAKEKPFKQIKSKSKKTPLTSDEFLKKMHGEHVIVDDNAQASFILKKLDNGNWQNVDGKSVYEYTPKQVGNDVAVGVVFDHTPVKKKAEPLNTTIAISVEDLHAKVAGDKILLDSGTISKMALVKLQNGMWQAVDPEGGDKYEDSEVEIDVNYGHAFNYHYSKKNLKAAKAGDQVLEVLPDNQLNSFTKNADNSWTMEGKAGVYPQTALYPAAEEGFLVEVFKQDDAALVQDSVEVKRIEKESSQIVAPPKGSHILEDFDAFTNGDEIKQDFSDGSTVTYTKMGVDSWMGDGSLPLVLEEADLINALNNGELYMDAEVSEFDASSLDSDPTGSKLKVATPKNSSTPGHWEKQPSGVWKHSGSGVLADSANMSTIVSGNEASGWYKEAPNAKIEALLVGAKIPNMEWVQKADEGTVIAVSVGSESETAYLMKGGMWLAPSGDYYHSAAFTHAIQIGNLHLKSYPAANKAAEIAPEAPSIDGTDSVAGDSIQIWSGGTSYQKSDIQAAVDALEAHSGFQIGYGLKAVPNNPIASKDAQEEIKTEALKKFPDLKPKPAFVAFLKDALGIKTEKKKSDSPTVNIGDKTPKTTQTGPTGGVFSADEIQDAVNILEGYNGKVFKSELSKKGNSLGELNWNEIVGFSKDKNETKQKVTDLLKAKLARNEKKNKHKEEDTFLADWEKELLEIPVEKSAHPEIPITSYEEFKTYPVGTKVMYQITFPETGKKHTPGFYTKGENSWKSEETGTPLSDNMFEGSIHSGSLYLISKPSSVPDYAKTPTALQNKADPVHVDSPSFPKKILAGKYNGGGKSYMVVHGDGTGVFVGVSGKVTALTSEKAFANYNVGMNVYEGMPDVIPTVTADESAKAKVAAKKVGDISELADGTYYLGDPSSPTTVVYDVSGDGVTVHNPKKSTEGSTSKIGNKITQSWMDSAAEGAVFGNSYNDSHTFTKKDGSWHNANGVLQTQNEVQYMINWNTDYKIFGHGTGEVTEMPKAKLKTQFLKGKLLDSNGNSILPKGYTGVVSIFGGESTVPTLLAVQGDLDGDESLKALLKKHAMWVNPKLLQIEAQKVAGPEGVVDQKAVLKAHIDTVLLNVEKTVPDSGAANLFDWDSLGSATMPEEIAKLYVPEYWETSTQNDYVKVVSSHFGGGKIIGQHMNKMSDSQKGTWIKSFLAGDFSTMYKLEVEAASKQNKPHASGYMHPGYSGNKSTNKVAWGAAVKGELSALTKVEGDWTSSSLEATQAEIDNYLLKAQMQNPTHLSKQERRYWVTYHQDNNQKQVDYLSLLAKNRNDQGLKPLTDPLEWTDDIKPAKSYDSVFDSGKFPTEGWNYKKAKDYYNDFSTQIPELVTHYEAKKVEHPYAGDESVIKVAVIAYMEEKKYAYEQELLIPIYTKKQNQNVQQSTHPVFQYSDQFGKEYFFKPREDTKLDKYRSEVEHLGNQFGKFFGFSTSGSKLVTLDGKYGQLQQDVGGVSDLMNADYSKLTVQQIADIGNEHLLDWFLDNDDTKGDNAKILANGRIVGIDKGRAFKHFGAWNGLSGDSQMDTNAATIYNQLYSQIRAGKISKEDVDKAYLQIQKRAGKMQKASDTRILEMLEEGMVNRESWDVQYQIDGKSLPNTKQGMFDSILDRKSKLSAQLDEMWTKIYKDSGFGDLPEKPNNPLGDVISGFDDARLHEELFIAEVNGKSTMLGGSHIIGGTGLMWTDKDTAGKNNINGEMFVAPKKQKQLLDWFIQNATDLTPKQAQTVGFGVFDTYGDSLINGAKTINTHAVDGNYNESKVKAFEDASAKIKGDLDEWTTTLKSNATLSGEDAYKFKSGNTVPMKYVDQYKLMLDHYSNVVPNIEDAYLNKGKAQKVEKFSPMVFSSVGTYTDAAGHTATFLADGGILWNFGTVYTTKQTDEHSVESLEHDGWKKVGKTSEPTSGLIITKNKQTNEQIGKLDGATKTITGTYQPHSNEGAQGQEYQITLPTGEKIFFRNAGQTGTVRAQQGKLMFRADGVEDAEASQAAIERILEQLNAMGFDTNPSGLEDAELTYWREMYGVLENRLHEDGGEYQNAKKEMDLKVKELGTPEHFLENLSESMTTEEEVQYWRDLWSKHIGADKVDQLVTSESFLPKYDHQNLKNPTLETGKPYWERFDISVEDIYKENKILMSKTGGEPNPMIKAGAALGAEERMRQADDFSAGGKAWSATSDQAKGSSHNIYTRIKSFTDTDEYNAFYDPRALLRTRTYSFASDHYGDFEYRKKEAPSNPLTAMKKYTGEGNETSLPHMATLLDTIELYAFDNINDRNEMIQYLKALGLDMIRGLSVEDRLVMRTNLQKALEKVKQTWTQ